MNFTDKIGIITVLYRSESVMLDFFESLKNQTYDNLILYIIDNKSPDNSLTLCRDLAEKHSLRTVIIENDENLGIAEGNNIGIKRALEDSCEYILLSNNDVVFSPDTIEKLYAGLFRNSAQICVPKIFYYGTDILWMAGGTFSYREPLGVHYGYNQRDTEVYSHDRKIEYAPTCFMLIAKEVFSTVGLMDKDYFVYWDDTDFMYRALLAGINVFYISSSIVNHKESISTGKASDFSIYYLARNQIYFIRKHFPLRKYWYISIHFILHFSKRLFLFEGKKWKLMLKAMLDGIRMPLRISN